MKIAIIANGYPDKREPQWGCFEKDQALALQQYMLMHVSVPIGEK